jgi:hypothetical protein
MGGGSWGGSRGGGSSWGGGGGGGGSAGSKITLNAAVINRIDSLPFVEEVIPSYQSQVLIKSKGEEKSNAALSIDPNLSCDGGCGGGELPGQYCKIFIKYIVQKKVVFRIKLK